ncbi:hypothetical protein [Companilactobacillus nantensis]|nr:hypothetical protein [Companilactobacillus nantensis]GEO63356.1 hypothetical protein LNA01_05390 [Companilactobacillus nantensis]
MTTEFSGDFSDQRLTFKLDNLGEVKYYKKQPTEVDDEAIFIIIKENLMAGLSYGSLEDWSEDSNFVEIDVPENIIASDFFYFLTKEFDQAGYELSVGYEMTISPESINVYSEYLEKILPLLSFFGVKMVKPKKVAMKPRHKYVKSLTDVPFSIDYKGSKATVYWVKRNEFLIKAGANLLETAPLTKAGVIGFAGKFGLRLREEHADQIKNNVLIQDVKLRSVNEVGTFLYFAGTNSWLQLKSPEGKTLHELTVVK